MLSYSSEATQSYYHYFAPPLPPNVVLFTVAKKNAVVKKLCAKIYIDSTLEEKELGEINEDSTCINWSGTWSTEESEEADEILKLDRVLKLIVSEPVTEIEPNDEGIGSQDLSFKNDEDIVLSDEEVDKFEKSIENFEKEFKENQKTLKSFCKKVKSTGVKKPNKASDFFKPKCVKKEVLTDTSNLVDQAGDDKVNSKTTSEKKKDSINSSMKRPNPFNSSEVKTKKLFTPKTPESLSRKKSSKRNQSPSNAKFSDLIATERPSERWGHELCRTCADKAILIGGQGLRKQLNADSIWTLDLKTRLWKTEQADNPSIGRRVGHTAVYDDKKDVVYLYGGSKQNKWYNDVYALHLDSMTWEKIETIGKAPTRAYHTCSKFYDELFMFGGVYPNPDPKPDGCSNELVIYDIENRSWYTPIVDGDIPTPRSGHSAVVMNSKLFIFGGWDAPKCHQDIYSLDIVIMKYTKLKATGEAPCARTWHSTTPLKDGNRFCIYGGYDGNQSLNDIFIFDSVKISWTKVQNDKIGRAGHSALLATNSESDDKEKLIIFGGGDNDGGYFNDLVDIVL